jgi:predicted dehydrogenase
MTAFPMRFDASVRAVRESMQRGELGTLRAVSGINHSEIPRAHRAWFAQRELAGGGAVMDHTVHLTDLLRWYTGAEVHEVFAMVGNPFYPGRWTSTPPASPRCFENGVFASVDCSWSRPTSYPRWGHLKMELFGDRGAMRVDAFAQVLTAYSRQLPRNPSWLGWSTDPNQAMIEAFVASVEPGASRR